MWSPGLRHSESELKNFRKCCCQLQWHALCLCVLHPQPTAGTPGQFAQLTSTPATLGLEFSSFSMPCDTPSPPLGWKGCRVLWSSAHCILASDFRVLQSNGRDATQMLLLAHRYRRPREHRVLSLEGSGGWGCNEKARQPASHTKCSFSR